MSCKKTVKNLTASPACPCGLLIWLFIAVCLLFAGNASAAVYYLNAATGNDAGPGTSAQPWKTIQRALPNYSGTPRVTGGDTVIIAAGSYGSFSYSQSSTGRNSYITYRAADAGNKPRFSSLSISSTPNAYIKLQDVDFRPTTSALPVNMSNCSYVYLQGCDIVGYSYTPYGLDLRYADNVTFNDCYMAKGAHVLLVRYCNNMLVENCEITDSDKDTFYCVDSTNITLRGCFIHSPGGGSHSDTVSWTGTNGITVQNCIIYNAVGNNEQGLYFTDDFNHRWSNALIENNLIYGNFLGRSVNVEGGDNMTFRNNTCVAKTTSSAISGGVAFSGDCTGIKIYNNIFQNTGVTTGSATDNHNIYQSFLSGSRGPNSIINTTVAFKNPSAGDYTLTATSAAVNFGNAATASTTDMLGLSRGSQPDAGCYEYNGSTPPPPPPPINSPPTLAPIGNKSVNADQTLSFQVSASDPDGDAITYSAVNLPQGATFSNRTFNWTPTSTQAGTHSTTFTASDGQLQDSETITITVVYNPPPPLGTYYVDAVNGNDSNPGSAAQPWKTMQRALPNYTGTGNKVTQGNTVIISPGNYGTVTYNENKNTGRTDWITYKAANPDNKPIFQDLRIRSTTNTWMSFDGIRIRSLCADRTLGFCAGTSATSNRVTNVRLLNSFVEHANPVNTDLYTLSILYADNITIENTEITGGEYNIVASYSTNLTFKNIKAHDPRRDGITLQVCDKILIEDSEIYNIDLASTTAHQDCISIADCIDVTIRRNKLHDGNSQGLYFTNDFGRNCSNVRIENNLIYGGFLGRPLQVLSTDNVVIVNNTIAADWTGFPGLTNSGIYVGADCTNAYIYNNICQNTGSAFLGTATENHNIHHRYNSSNLGANSLNNTIIQFADAANDDYCLSTGCVAIDRADTANAPATDITNTPRDSKPDAGCYEHPKTLPATRIVGHWEFKEMTGTTAQDSSASGNSGTLIGTPAWTQGRFDGAINFTTTAQAVEVKTTDFSLEKGTVILWAKPSSFLSTTQFLFAHVANGWSNRIQIYTNSSQGALGVGLGDTHRKATGIYNLLPNQWQQVALTWNAGTYAVYVNGTKRTTGTYTGLATLSSYADIANSGNRTDRHEAFAGIIDDARAYNYALSDSEISTLYAEQMWLFEPIGDKTVNENATLTFEVVQPEPVNPAVQITAQPLPAGAVFAQNVFTWTPNYSQAGTYDVNFVATNGQIQDTETITITVNNVNRSPVINTIGNKSGTVGSNLAFTVTASDPDGDNLTLTASSLPAGASFTNGTFQWTPQSSQVSTYSVTFTASDGQLQNTQSITITVTNGTGTNGLVGHWKLNETSGSVAADSSGTGNTGTLINAPVWTVGKLGGAIQLTTLSHAVEVKTAGLNLNQGTVCLWAKPTSFPSVAQFMFAHVANGWGNRIQIYTNNAQGALGIGIGNTHKKATNIMNLAANTWYHIALTWQSGSYAVYVNGTIRTTGSYSGLSTLSTYADIGNTGYRTDRNEAFKGVVDDVRMYNRALTAAEITTVYQSQ